MVPCFSLYWSNWSYEGFRGANVYFKYYFQIYWQLKKAYKLFVNRNEEFNRSPSFAQHCLRISSLFRFGGQIYQSSEYNRMEPQSDWVEWIDVNDKCRIPAGASWLVFELPPWNAFTLEISGSDLNLSDWLAALFSNQVTGCMIGWRIFLQCHVINYYYLCGRLADRDRRIEHRGFKALQHQGGFLVFNGNQD